MESMGPGNSCWPLAKMLAPARRRGRLRRSVHTVCGLRHALAEFPARKGQPIVVFQLCRELIYVCAHTSITIEAILRKKRGGRG
jgi:hypothetical protein